MMSDKAADKATVTKADMAKAIADAPSTDAPAVTKAEMSKALSEAPAAPVGIARPEMDRAIADAKGWVKAWVRQEIRLMQAGESELTRQQKNP